VHDEDAYYGHLVFRRMDCLASFYAPQVICRRLYASHEQGKQYWGRGNAPSRIFPQES
jgi:hypothetical protein